MRIISLFDVYMVKKRIQMNRKLKFFLSSPEKIPKSLTILGREYFPKEFISSDGYKSVVWKGIDHYNAPVIIKIATYEDYTTRSFLDEVSKTVKLRHYSEFANFYDAGIIEIIGQQNRKMKCICFIEEYIDGDTLEKYIEKNQITPRFIINYIRALCNVLSILKKLKLRHDDLSLKNVMIAKPKPGTLSEEFSVKIIDMGSLKDDNLPCTKERDDHGRFTEHLIELYNSILCTPSKERRSLSLFERRFQKEMFPLLKSMLEEDKQIALIDPSKILKQFEHILIRAQNPNNERKLKLEDPFDYISAEHISSDELLIKLFAESCPWFKEVISPNPILLTGPRGCGKSMLFRRLSLKALLFKTKEDILDSKIAGFYISCSANFQNRFGRITSEYMIRKFQKEIIHYFNLLLTLEIIHTFLSISQRSDREQVFGFGNIQEKELHEYLINKLNIKEERKLRLQGVTPLEHLLEIIEYEMDYCYDNFLKRINLESTTPISFISDFTKFLNKKIQYLHDRPIAFLLDDFSIHRISENIQLIINPILWDRQSTHLFKLSTEKYGAERIFEFPSESSSPTADITREFREIDCGRFYISLSDGDKLNDLVVFAKDLLNHRLELAEFSGNSETIIGHSSYKQGSLTKSLKFEPKVNNQYHGLETISEICSGDISALLEIYRRIFQEGKVDKSTNTIVSKHIQHKAIKSVSGNFLDLIKTYHPYGSEMDKIIVSFGTLCRWILHDGKEMNYPQKDGTIKLVPCETTRIEVDQIPNASNEDFTEDQSSFMKELVRRSIFIEMEPGRGRHSLGPTWRWQLRRIYCPVFAIGLKKNTAIKWNTSDLKYFLINPREKCRQEFERWKQIKDKKPDEQVEESQTTLFDNFSEANHG